MSERLGARPWVMLALGLLAQTATSVLISTPAFLIPELHARGIPLATAGLLASTTTAGMVIAPRGLGCDRRSRRRTLGARGRTCPRGGRGRGWRGIRLQFRGARGIPRDRRHRGREFEPGERAARRRLVPAQPPRPRDGNPPDVAAPRGRDRGPGGSADRRGRGDPRRPSAVRAVLRRPRDRVRAGHPRPGARAPREVGRAAPPIPTAATARCCASTPPRSCWSCRSSPSRRSGWSG